MRLLLRFFSTRVSLRGWVERTTGQGRRKGKANQVQARHRQLLFYVRKGTQPIRQYMDLVETLCLSGDRRVTYSGPNLFESTIRLRFAQPRRANPTTCGVARRDSRPKLRAPPRTTSNVDSPEEYGDFRLHNETQAPHLWRRIYPQPIDLLSFHTRLDKHSAPFPTIPSHTDLCWEIGSHGTRGTSGRPAVAKSKPRTRHRSLNSYNRHTGIRRQ